MQVINKDLTQAIHTVIDTLPYDVKITIVQPQYEHNIPWHYINEEYLFKVEAGFEEWVECPVDYDPNLDVDFKTVYATTPKRLASIMHGKLCRYLGVDLLDYKYIKEYEEDTGKKIWMPGCVEDEVGMRDGHSLICAVQMLDWYWEKERRANDHCYECEECCIPMSNEAPF